MPCFEHGSHVLGVFGKTQLFAINTAWINMSLGGNSSFHVLFSMEYQFCVGTSFAMDIWKTLFSYEHVTYHVYHQPQGIM